MREKFLDVFTPRNVHHALPNDPTPIQTLSTVMLDFPCVVRLVEGPLSPRSHSPFSPARLYSTSSKSPNPCFNFQALKLSIVEITSRSQPRPLHFPSAIPFVFNVTIAKHSISLSVAFLCSFWLLLSPNDIMTSHIRYRIYTEGYCLFTTYCICQDPDYTVTLPYQRSLSRLHAILYHWPKENKPALTDPGCQACLWFLTTKYELQCKTGALNLCEYL